MELSHAVNFTVPLAASYPEAKEFVRDVPRSLRYAEIVSDLKVFENGEASEVSASLPVSAALFGQHVLPFRSALRPTASGAVLEALPVYGRGPGSAEVNGSAVVRPSANGCEVDYSFLITVKLTLPAGGKWGEKALLKLVGLTAQSVLRNLASQLEPAVARAAAELNGPTSPRRNARRSTPASPR